MKKSKMTEKKLAIIGDIHGKDYLHEQLIDAYPKTLQLGDLGFDYSYLDMYGSRNHRFFPGNHDNYDICYDYAHCLKGDCGKIPFKFKDYESPWFCRGALSIDKNYRIPEVDWWENEEVEDKSLFKVINNYLKHKPDLVVTHDGPYGVTRDLCNKGLALPFNYEMNKNIFLTSTSVVYP